MANLLILFGAEDGTRTRDPNLGKVMLYQLSHFRAQADTIRHGNVSGKCNLRKSFQKNLLPSSLVAVLYRLADARRPMGG